MPAGLTQAAVVNRALQEIAAQVGVTGTSPNFSGPNSAASTAAGVLYSGVVETLLRDMNPEFARRINVPLVASGNAAEYPWTEEYLYPGDCLKVRSVAPATWDANDPQPVRWTVATDTVDGVPAEVIMCSITPVVLTYTSSNVTEAQWDSIFTEAAVRLLASEVVMSLGGRPDFSEKMLASSGQLVGADVDRDS